MTRRKPCPPSRHVWKRLRGGRYEKCQACGVTFPCRGRCEHVDCCHVKGVEPPAGVRWLMAFVGVAMDTKGLAPWAKKETR